MSEFKFIAMKNIDQSAVQVVAYEDRQEMGTLIFTPQGWEEFKEKIHRTKVKCES